MNKKKVYNNNQRFYLLYNIPCILKDHIENLLHFATNFYIILLTAWFISFAYELRILFEYWKGKYICKKINK